MSDLLIVTFIGLVIAGGFLCKYLNKRYGFMFALGICVVLSFSIYFFIALLAGKIL